MDGYNVFVDGYPSKCGYFENYDVMKMCVEELEAEGFKTIGVMNVANVFMTIMKEKL